jgi:hypothetical protein
MKTMDEDEDLSGDPTEYLAQKTKSYMQVSLVKYQLAKQPIRYA